jgi:hypothetical protein
MMTLLTVGSVVLAVINVGVMWAMAHRWRFAWHGNLGLQLAWLPYDFLTRQYGLLALGAVMTFVSIKAIIVGATVKEGAPVRSQPRHRRPRRSAGTRPWVLRRPRPGRAGVSAGERARRRPSWSRREAARPANRDGTLAPDAAGPVTIAAAVDGDHITGAGWYLPRDDDPGSRYTPAPHQGAASSPGLSPMTDDPDGRAARMRLLQQVEGLKELLAGDEVQADGRLVGQQEAWLAEQRTVALPVRQDWPSLVGHGEPLTTAQFLVGGLPVGRSLGHPGDPAQDGLADR